MITGISGTEQTSQIASNIAPPCQSGGMWLTGQEATRVETTSGEAQHLWRSAIPDPVVAG